MSTYTIKIPLNNAQLSKVFRGEAFNFKFKQLISPNIVQIDLPLTEYDKLTENIRKEKGYKFKKGKYMINNNNGATIYSLDGSTGDIERFNGGAITGKRLGRNIKKSFNQLGKNIGRSATTIGDKILAVGTKSANDHVAKMQDVADARVDRLNEQANNRLNRLYKLPAGAMVDPNIQSAMSQELANQVNDAAPDSYVYDDQGPGSSTLGGKIGPYGRMGDAIYNGMQAYDHGKKQVGNAFKSVKKAFGGKLVKGSQAAKDKMALVRASRSLSGGSLKRDFNQTMKKVGRVAKSAGKSFLQQAAPAAIEGAFEGLRTGMDYVAPGSSLAVASQLNNLENRATRGTDRAINGLGIQSSINSTYPNAYLLHQNQTWRQIAKTKKITGSGFLPY